MEPQNDPFTALGNLGDYMKVPCSDPLGGLGESCGPQIPCMTMV